MPFGDADDANLDGGDKEDADIPVGWLVVWLGRRYASPYAVDPETLTRWGRVFVTSSMGSFGAKCTRLATYFSTPIAAQVNNSQSWNRRLEQQEVCDWVRCTFPMFSRFILSFWNSSTASKTRLAAKPYASSKWHSGTYPHLFESCFICPHAQPDLIGLGLNPCTAGITDICDVNTFK